MSHENSGVVFIVDDDRYVLDSVSMLLEASGFTIVSFDNPQEAFRRFATEPVDLVLTDINMPGMTGIELLEKIRKLDKETPVILMTAFADLDVAVKAIQKGAFDFIIKPYNPTYLLHSVEKALTFKRLTAMEKNYKKELELTVARRTAELNQSLEQLTNMSRELIERLTIAAELRDEDTGLHISRIGMYASRMALHLGLSDDYVENIFLSSSMHDVGKIGIPDSILLKAGALTPEEFSVIKQHTLIGEKILKDSTHEMLQMGARIAAMHHERWDGTGYPRGLKGDAVPLEARIVMIVDQYDALRNSRVYKPAFDHQKTCSIILDGDGRTMPAHFDPEILKAFEAIADELDAIFSNYKG